MKKERDMKKALFLALPFLYGVAHAEPLDLNLSESCQDIVIALESNENRYFQEGAIYNLFYGFTMGANIASSGVHGDRSYSNLDAGIKPEFVFAYVKNFCLNHPDDNLLIAVDNLFLDLHKRK